MKDLLDTIDLYDNNTSDMADGERIGFNKGLRASTDYTQGKGTDTFTEAQKLTMKKVGK